MNRVTTSLAVAALSLGVLTAAAHAATVDFATADTDHNAEVSMTELLEVMKTVTPEQFAAADTDKSGSLNQSEYNAIPDAASLSTAPATGGDATDTNTKTK
jgi:Ca2+-binding EF-hand superfamily protein